MTGIELLEKYPLSAKIIKDWFLGQMIESLKKETIDEEFKTFMREQGIDDDKMGTLIDVNPVMLFPVFDNNEIFISIKVTNTSFENSMKVTFLYKINDKGEYIIRKFTRKEIELVAIEEAFEILENKLTPIDLPKLEE